MTDRPGQSGSAQRTNEKTSAADANENEGSLFGDVGRRTYLKAGAAVTLGTAGVSASASAETRDGITFDRVLDAVDDLGMSPNGDEPIDDKLAGAWGSDTLIEFPAGEYLVTRELRTNNVSNFGLVGATGDRSDVEFVFPSGYNDRFLNIRFGKNWLIGDFTIQQSDDKETGVSCSFGPDDNATFRNFEIAGYNPRNKQRGLGFIVYSEDGEATIENYVRTGKSAVGDYPSGTQALLVPTQHVGTVTIRDAHIENAGENGIYASRCPGDVKIEGGYFANNDIASVRIAGEGSYVKGASFVVDTDNANVSGEFYNPGGLWIESGSKGYLGGVVEDCDFEMLSTDMSRGLLRVQTTAGDVEIKNCRFRNETRWGTIVGEKPSGVSGSGPLTVRNCSIVGGASDPTVGAIHLEGRDDSLVEECCIQMDGENHGVVVENASGCAVRRSTINVNGKTIHSPGSSVATSGISESGSCPAPSVGSSDSGSKSSSDSSSDSGSDSSQTETETETATETETETETETATETESNESTATETESNESTATATETETETATETESNESTTTETESNESTATETESNESTTTESESNKSTETATETETSTSTDDESSSSSSSETGDSKGDSSEKTHTILIQGEELSPYEFTVSGDVSFDPGWGNEDRIDGSTVSGVLAGGGDRYRFSGEITSFDVDGSPDVYVDGTSVDSSSLPSGSKEPKLSNRIIVKSDDFAPYELEVDGDIAIDPKWGDEDKTDDSSVSSVLAGGGDAFLFSGTITRFEHEGEVDVTVNGESVDSSNVVGCGDD